MSDPTLVSVVVAASAVIVGAVMQYMTLRTTRRNTLSSLRVGATESEISRLQGALAEHLTLTYSINSYYRAFKLNGQQFPPDHVDLAIKEDQLFNLIRLHLNTDEPTHQRLLEAIAELRNGDSNELWTVRRDEVIARATTAFAHDRHQLFGRG